MIKPRIFIGSSKEGLVVAQKIKDFFSEYYECFIWTDGIFKHNQGILETLLKSASLFDFGLMVFTKDDLSEIRGELKFTPRDNILFEYGLFLGRVGIDKAYMICEDGVKIPSDMAGINLAFFKSHKHKNKENQTLPTSSLEEELKLLKNNMDEKLRLGYLGLMPSTVIAISYFENFVRVVAENLCKQNGFDIGGHHYKSGKLKIVIPLNLDGDMKSHASVYFSRINCKSESIPANHRPYPIFVAAEDSEEDSDYIEVADMPTILNGVDKAIDMYFSRGCIGKLPEQQLTEDRELRNFVNVLKLLIHRDPFSKSVVTIVDENDNSLMD